MIELWKMVLYGIFCVGLGYFVAYIRMASTVRRARDKLLEAEKVLRESGRILKELENRID